MTATSENRGAQIQQRRRARYAVLRSKVVDWVEHSEEDGLVSFTIGFTDGTHFDVGLLFCAGVYPLTVFFRQDPALAMMLSLYVTLGIFLLIAARNPSASRSLIAFTAWSSFAHAAVMGVQAFRNLIARGELIGVAALIVIGVALIALAPAKPSRERASAVVA